VCIIQVVPDYVMVGRWHHRCSTAARIKTHLANSIEDVLLAGDVSRKEGDIVVSLDDVKDRNDVATSDELFDNMSADETAPTYDQVDVFVFCGHFCRCNCNLVVPFCIF